MFFLKGTSFHLLIQRKNMFTINHKKNTCGEQTNNHSKICINNICLPYGCNWLFKYFCELLNTYFYLYSREQRCDFRLRVYFKTTLIRKSNWFMSHIFHMRPTFVINDPKTNLRTDIFLFKTNLIPFLPPRVIKFSKRKIKIDSQR